ncbi:hypothetical protein AB0395_39050 [Streptosporangium sp. NPDC051023]|uniref:glycoside hydrolase family 2 protein n=1 Tax=Streptosporangium sp. NPDC051023 TaxID=3155410 RepID=UPI00344D2EE7
MTPMCERFPLTEGWSATGVPAGAVNEPRALDRQTGTWEAAPVPGTVAETFRGLPADAIDGRDWWYRVTFALSPIADGERLTLCLDGLATLADVWFNGVHVLTSRSMFRAHRVDIRELARTENDLAIRFSSLHALLSRRRPRPRWRTRLVEHQGLRFVRTSLLGRMPGWSARHPAVGPWRPVAIERWRPPRLRERRIATVVSETSARVDVAITLDVDAMAHAEIKGAVALCGVQAACGWAPLGAETLVGTATIEVPRPARWWPHTHGAQPLHRLSATLTTGSSTQGMTLDLGHVGLRSLTVDRADEGFALRVNDVDVFCRGACWTPLHPVSLRATEAEYRAALEAARDAGMNMVRIAGPTVYEDDAFFDVCDELGILVWQDFMFASLDYPVDDGELRAEIEAESRQELLRWQGRPSLAVLCGGSELEQQPAMLGAPPEVWARPPIAELLARPCAELLGEVPFWPSTPHGGVFPFSLDAGTAHYYGVGAYLRGLDDLRRSAVRFATECLAVAQVPEDPPTKAGRRVSAAAIGDAAWKAAVPRDAGAGWDFDDVRDHYLARLYGIDPLRCRYEDPQRYLELSRTVPGELMTAAFSEWRRSRSMCRGGLVWFLQDLEPGAGWGIRDAWGRPKAAYFYLRRVLAPVTVVVTDEGLNGLDAHVVNERDEPLEAELALALHDFAGARARGAGTCLTIAARGCTTLRLDTLLPGFTDLTHAYRFGPAGHDVAVVSLRRAGGSMIAEAWHFPGPRLAPLRPEVGLGGRCERLSPGESIIHLETRDFAQAVTLTSDEFEPADSYFHMPPASRRGVTLRAREPGRPGTVVLRSLNSRAAVRIGVD